MYLKYTYAAGSTAENIVADILKVITGTTDKTLLSANCVQASTEIISTTPAGWALFDNVNALNPVISAPCADGVTTKYVQITGSTTQIYLKGYESWNATTHVGTNLCYNSNSSSSGYVSINATSGGVFYLFSSARSIAAWSSLSTNVFQMIMEHTRDDPWDTAANGQPCWGYAGYQVCSSASNASPLYKPRRINGYGSDLTTNSAGLSLTGPFGTSDSVSSVTLYTTCPRDIGKNASMLNTHILCPIQASDAGSNTTRVATIGGRIYDFYLTSYVLGVTNDELTYNGQQYVILSNGARIVVPKF
jgi:hypothetical protein